MDLQKGPQEVTDNMKDDDETSAKAKARQVAERRLVRKIDICLLPIVIIIFFMNHIDRITITSARLKGLRKDLHLSDIQYDTVVGILNISYCPAQIPSNLVLNRVSRPAFFIGACVTLWGLTTALTGYTHNFVQIMVCRIILGFPEAVFFPGAIYLFSRWYTRKELAVRAAVLHAGLLLSNAFGGLMAAGVLAHMNKVRGIAAWRWLFYINGAITMCVGIVSIWLLPSYPNNTKWLSPEERHLAQVRLAEDAGEADEDPKGASFLEGLKLALKDPKILIFMVMCCSQQIGLSFLNFFPTLTATLGYSTTVSLLLVAPPWIFAAIIALVNARHSDATGERFFHLAVWWWGVMIGYVISLSTMNKGARYFSMFLMASGYCGFTLTLVWLIDAAPRPRAKRSAAIGLVNGFGNAGNLIGSYVWRAKWSPEYHPSMIICLCALALTTALSLVIRLLLVRDNKHMECREMELMNGPERERIEQAAKLEGIPFDEALRRRKAFRHLY